MAEIWESDKQTSVGSKNYLKGLCAQIASLDDADHALGSNGVDIASLKTVHPNQYRPRFGTIYKR